MLDSALEGTVRPQDWVEVANGSYHIDLSRVREESCDNAQSFTVALGRALSEIAAKNPHSNLYPVVVRSEPHRFGCQTLVPVHVSVTVLRNK